MKSVGFILGLLIFFLLTLFITPEVMAQTCTGSYTCTGVSSVCNPAGCAIGTPGCTCSTQCGPFTQSFSCSGFNQSTCGTGSSWVCDELCGLQSWSCSWSSGGGSTPPGGGGGGGVCTIDANCGANSRCCAGSSGNYCSSSCYDCAGNYICSPPTPTPVPVTCNVYSGPTCQGGCGGSYYDVYTCSNGSTSMNRVPSADSSCLSCTWCGPGQGNCPAPTPTRTCTYSGVDCAGGCGGSYYDVYSCSDGTTSRNRVTSADSSCLSCAWCGPGQGNCPASTPTPNSCPSFGSNASRYCSGTSIYDRYANGSCGYNVEFFYDCADSGQTCSNGQCVSGPTPTRTPTPVSTSCSSACGPWTTLVCGGGTCSDAQMQEVRNCAAGSSCSEFRCVASSSCGGSNPTTTPTPTPASVCYQTCSPDSSQVCVAGCAGGSCTTCSSGCCGYNAATFSYTCGMPCGTSSASPTPTRTPAPTSTTSSISGRVYKDADGNRERNNVRPAACVSACDSEYDACVANCNFLDFTCRNNCSNAQNTCESSCDTEPYLGGITVRVARNGTLVDTDTTSQPSSSFFTSGGAFNLSVPNGPASYVVSVQAPSGYQITEPLQGQYSFTASGSFNTGGRDFGLYQQPSPVCTNGLTKSPTTSIQPGGESNLTVGICSNVENPPNSVSPPPYDWDPPQDDNPTNEGTPQCSDGIDNDGDGKTDEEDPSCHWDGDPDDDNDGVPDNVDPDSPDSYTPADDNESPKDTTPQCSDGLDNDGDGYRDIEDPECHSDGNPDSNNDGTPDNDDGSYTPNDDNESDRVSEGTPGNPETGSNQCSDGGLVVQSATTTGSTATWTAPQCPTQQLTCTINTTVSGPGGTYLDATDVTVRRSGQIDVEVVDVSSGGDCASAPPYTDPITLNLSGPVSTTEEITDGTYSFVCLPNGAYTVAIGLPPGYQVAAGGSFQQTTTVTNNTRSVRFCIANFEPWFQTDTGDVRMNGIVNPVPGGHLGSTGIQSGVAEPYPGVFHSTTFTAEFDEENTISPKNWVVNKEYEYNAFNKNRNGTVAYSFYKSRAKQEGVAITPLSATDFTLDATTMNQLAATGIYEVGGNLTINAYTHPPDQRITLLVAGNVTINSNIAVPPGSLFILAARGNIVVTDTVGQADPSSVSPNLEGIYSAEGSIVLSGTECTDGTTPDRRLNIAGALIANALTPFSSGGAGRLQNQRSLCSDDNNYPSLSVLTRPDFLLTLTDFYKAPYTKWREMNP